MTYNDGIEAAAQAYELAGYPEDARVIRLLKRPEPSEEEKVEKIAAVIERELMIDESLLADPATLRKIKSRRIARAALKTMEQGQ